MMYAAVVRLPGNPPSPVPLFTAKDDAEALAIVQNVAKRHGAVVTMIWESRGDMARQVAV